MLADGAFSGARLIGFAGAVAGFAALLGCMAYFYNRRPPGCADASTVTLVRREVVRTLGLRIAPELANIQTHAGSVFAIRFVCSADFTNPDHLRLQNGVLVDSISYSSAWDSTDHAQRVTVTLEPVLTWQRVE